MPIIVDTFDQRSEDWIAARVGNPGASSISKIITPKGQISKQREEYLYQLAGETITGRCEEGFLSQAMINGIEREDASRTLFEMIHGVDVKQVGVVYKDERRAFHCSPDGLVGDDALLELKNPMLKTQTKYLLSGELPDEYFCQVQMSLYVTERPLCYFMSNYDGLPPFILEVRRNEDFIKKLEPALNDFVADLQKMVAKLRAIQERN